MGARLVAPPKQLEDGQKDIVGELREAQTGVKPPAAGAATTEEKRADVHRALGKQGASLVLERLQRSEPRGFERLGRGWDRGGSAPGGFS